MNLKKVLLFFLVIGFMPFVKAQSPVFRHYSTDQGLSSLETYHVFQDSKGYIWISTTNGVSRFDGYTFQNFEEQDGLSDNVIFETIEDYKGRIWFVGYNCKLSYYENGKLKPYKYNHVIEHLVNNRMVSVKSSFYIDQNDNVYLSISTRGLIRISAKGVLKKLTNFSNNLASIIERDKKLFVIQYSGTINELNINLNNIHVSIHDPKLEKSRKLAVFAVQSSDRSSLFLGCDHSLLHIYKDGHYQIREMASRIIWLSRDRNKMIWVGSYNGGVEAINENDFMGSIVHNYLKNNSVSSVLEDREGGIWFSTLDDGVFYLPSHNTFSYSYPADLPDDDILRVETGDKETYLGTGNGFLSVIKNNRITNYPIDTNLHSEITALTYDKVNKQLYVGSYYNTYIYKNGIISPLINFNNKRNKKYEGLMITFKSILKASSDLYWFGNFGGLSLVDVKQNQVLYNSTADNLRKGLRINSLYKYPDGALLIGTSEGLWEYKNNNFTKATGFIPGLNDRISQIAGDSLGNYVWIATKSNGLYLKTHDSIFHFSHKEGLLNNAPYGLCLNKNDLWLATSQGITCITIKSYKPFQYSLHNFTVENGLASNQVYQIKISGDKILVGTNKGLSILDKGSLKTTKSLIPLYITRVRLMMRDTILQNNSSLPFNYNSLSFSFVGISFQSITRMRYQYKLIGFDDEWHTTQNTEVSFPFLPPHRYEFQIRTINDDGIPTSSTVIQKFIIRLPYWKTGWFIIIVILSLLAGGYLIYRNRMRTIEKDNKIQQEINQYRQQALSKQMNPHFLFNSLNSIQYYIVKNDRISSSRFLSKFATLMRVILNNSQNQSISLNDEMSALKLYLELESMRFKDRFEYTIDMDPLINQLTTMIPPFIIHPFIENSIWHGLMNREGNGLLQIRFILEEFYLRCIITDNGVGRQHAAEIEGTNPFKSPSKGISITETRLRLIDKKGMQSDPVTYTDLYDHNGTPEGTRVEILIPIMN
jgi:ligand-binding sensor domain-containing protein